MWRRRMRSLSCILNQGRSHDVFPKIPAEILRSPKIHPPPPEQPRKLLLYSSKAKEARNVAVLENNEYIHITVGAKVLAENRAEQGKLEDVIPSAKFRKPVPANLDPRSSLMNIPSDSCEFQFRLDPRYIFEVAVVVEKGKIILDGDAGYEAIYGTPDRNARASAVEVYSGGLFIAFDGVFGKVESLRIHEIHEIVELGGRCGALQNFLIDEGRDAERLVSSLYFIEMLGGLVLDVPHIIDPHRSIHEIQNYIPSRSFLWS